MNLIVKESRLEIMAMSSAVTHTMVKFQAKIFRPKSYTDAKSVPSESPHKCTFSSVCSSQDQIMLNARCTERVPCISFSFPNIFSLH